MVIIQYDGTEAEMQRITQEQTASGLLLVEVQNVTAGNFLGFINPSPPPTPIEQEMNELKSRQADILIAMVMNNLM